MCTSKFDVFFTFTFEGMNMNTFLNTPLMYFHASYGMVCVGIWFVSPQTILVESMVWLGLTLGLFEAFACADSSCDVGLL